MASVVEQAFDCIKNKVSFVLDAGAGSGKTWTLVQALNYILETKSKELKNKMHIDFPQQNPVNFN